MKLYLDTNIILDYLLDSRGVFHEPAVALMRAIAHDVVEAGFSTSQATDLYYSLRTVAGDTAARKALQGLFELCELFTTPPEACIEAITSEMSDYEDAVQVKTAEFHRCDCLITRDQKHYDKSSLPALSAAEFLARCS